MSQNQDIYWNPVIETLPQEKVQTLQLKKFKHIVAWAYENSPYYKKLYKKAGLKPGDIKKYEDIQNVPKIEKDMMREVHPYGSLPRYEVKGKRFKDQRKEGG
jgi:phenylacetate-CoA ligase